MLILVEAKRLFLKHFRCYRLLWIEMFYNIRYSTRNLFFFDERLDDSGMYLTFATVIIRAFILIEDIIIRCNLLSRHVLISRLMPHGLGFIHLLLILYRLFELAHLIIEYSTGW